ncbi:MAG: mismatch-specific DNA-glycosylase [Rhodospirillaceae bacterium]|nr:mismatch-specific DNA-glycosylase [Rhodospirillaceae bacterium]
MPILPDILQPGLDIVFCGMAPSRVSAARGAYYAHPGNRFWPTLYETGLTPRLLAPEEFRLLPQWGIGLTDVNKTEIGRDIELSKAAHDPLGVRQRVLTFKPRFLATTSKTAGQLILGSACDYGLHTETIGDTQIFVLPSTSGAARGFWDIAPWRALAKAARG